MKELKSQDFKILGFGLIIILGLTLYAIFFSDTKNENNNQISELNKVSEEVIEKAVAGNLQLLFQCPCCGKSIAECSCPMAKERAAFIDGLSWAEMSKDEAIFTYVKKYGLSSFIDEEKEQEFRVKLVKEAPENRPIISLNSDVYNFGDISQKKGITTTFFEIKNNGKSDLIIDRLETSCGCTSASIVYQDEEGPKFSMPGHGINEEIGDWQISIAPGATAKLKVYYDPNVHSDFRGAATRDIYVYSNDPIDFEKKVQIELNQID